ncbi:uncharacterized protein LOC125512134 isoform X1 [Triticum urartu]|uniref:uncharacterized protein LOC125512133 isoform X1 n=2 Tax=Triticum urartu TaxID=4572 RepID=UPI002043653C|nr:uncharacterized protein LOC125512133 isoform X1 [Triticum urartu]XP_048533168.1 uncharacterized protein LOC125512134 isoform X1 [Triticum urartu]
MERPRGRRSLKDAKYWRCSKGYKNQPELHEFFDTPPFVCGCGCKQKHKGDFDFCLDHVTVNGSGLLGDFIDQADEELCIACTYGKQLEVTKRIKYLMKGRNPESPTPRVIPSDLDVKYEKMIGDYPKGGIAQLILMGLILKEQGILNESCTCIYKASNVSVIPEKDPARIVAALADGFPLNAGVIHGKKLSQLRYCQAYKAPSLRRVIQKRDMGRLKGIPGHAVLLVGAGRKEGKLYYYFMNSWDEFAVRKNNRGEIVGQSIGKISANRLYRNVIRLSRFKEAETAESLLPQPLPVTADCRNVVLLVP